MTTRRSLLQSGAAAAAVLAFGARSSRAANAPGVTDAEIKIGQTMPYSGPASAYGIIGRTESAYFRMINEQGGIAGRKLNLLSLDDAYSPPKTVEQTRRLVEQDQVAFMYNQLGTGPGLAVRQYLNDNKIPQLFMASGASVFDDPEHFPWTMGYAPSYQIEGRIFAKYILKNKPDAKIGILYQNDGFGKDYLVGAKTVFGTDYSKLVVKEASYEVSEPTVDSQVVSLQGSGADVFYIVATPKFAAQAIRKSADLGWNAARFLTNVSISVSSVLKPAGFDKAKGVISLSYGKDPSDPRWKDDAGVKQWADFVAKYLSPVDFTDSSAYYGFGAARTMVYVLQQCGNDFSRENIMHQATNIHDLELPMLLPGIKINTNSTSFSPLRQMQLQTFDGQGWQLSGELLSG